MDCNEITPLSLQLSNNELYPDCPDVIQIAFFRRCGTIC